MKVEEADIKENLGADDIENVENEWNIVENAVDIDAEDVNSFITRPFFYIKKIHSGHTIGNVVARLLNEFFTEKEKFWVDLEDQDIYCQDPCPVNGNCCSIEDPAKTTTTTEGPLGPVENKRIPTTPIFPPIKRYSWFTWVDNHKNDFTLVQDYGEPQESLYCGSVEITNTAQLDFIRENCNANRKPLCMRKTPQIVRKKNTRKRISQQKKKTRKNKKRGKRSSGRQGRQLTGTGRPIEMCATVLPALVGNKDITRMRRPPRSLKVSS